MPLIKINIEVNAPIERVFDLARCVELHTETMINHNEKAVGSITRGLLNTGEIVTWEAIHFGIRQKLTSKITAFDRPRHFRDEMVSGAFKSFTHDHIFAETESGTKMTDIFDYQSPLRFLGKIADWMFLEKYMQTMLEERNLIIKAVAESNEWKKFLR